MPALRISGYSRSPKLLDNAQAVREWFVGLAERIGVQIVNGPTVHSFKDSGQPEAGLTGFAIIAESHIACHTWPELAYCLFEITSCKSFDLQQAAGYTITYFDMEVPLTSVFDPQWGNLP